MSGKFEELGNFKIPSELLDFHEWMADSFIDDLGLDCTLVYPPSDSECTNCLYDPTTGRSADIYKDGGAYSFPDHTLCPLCGGVGKLSQPVTADITLRVYWGGMEVNAAMRQFANINLADAPNGMLFVIGYMNDRPNYIRSDEIQIPHQENIRTKRISEAIPWGFRKNRYFAGMLGRQ